MLFKWRVRPHLKYLAPWFYPRCGYHWGTYDASSGECCKMQTGCVWKTSCGRLRPLENRCKLRVDEESVLARAYPKQLMEILMRSKQVEKCDLFKHDLCYYQPSDKTRRFQRTWGECPRIWLRPRQVCCFDKEYHCPIERRPRPPQLPEKSVQEVYAFQMDQICKFYTRMGQEKKMKCRLVKIPKNCEKVKAPFPSFSECKTEGIPKFCRSECACRVKPNLCELWRLYQQKAEPMKKCTEAIVGYCPFKNRSR